MGDDKGFRVIRRRFFDEVPDDPEQRIKENDSSRKPDRAPEIEKQSPVTPSVVDQFISEGQVPKIRVGEDTYVEGGELFFSEDLLAQIAGMPEDSVMVVAPPLRQRADSLPPLAWGANTDFNMPDGELIRIPSKGVSQLVVDIMANYSNIARWEEDGYLASVDEATQLYFNSLPAGHERIYSDARYVREFLTKVGIMSPYLADVAAAVYVKLADKFTDCEGTVNEIREWFKSDYLEFMETGDQGAQTVCVLLIRTLEDLRDKYPHIVARAGFKRAKGQPDETAQMIYGPAMVYAQNYELYRFYQDPREAKREEEMTGLFNLLITAGNDRHQAAFAESALTYYLRVFYGEEDESSARTWIRRIIDVSLDDSRTHVVRAYAQRTLQWLGTPIAYSNFHSIAPRLWAAVEKYEMFDTGDIHVGGYLREPSEYISWISEELEPAVVDYLSLGDAGRSLMGMDASERATGEDAQRIIRRLIEMDAGEPPFSARRYAAEHALAAIVPNAEEMVVREAMNMSAIIRGRAERVEDEAVGKTLADQYVRSASWITDNDFDNHLVTGLKTQFIGNEHRSIMGMARSSIPAHVSFAHHVMTNLPALGG